MGRKKKWKKCNTMNFSWHLCVPIWAIKNILLLKVIYFWEIFCSYLDKWLSLENKSWEGNLILISCLFSIIFPFQALQLAILLGISSLAIYLPTENQYPSVSISRFRREILISSMWHHLSYLPRIIFTIRKFVNIKTLFTYLWMLCQIKCKQAGEIVQ